MEKTKSIIPFMHPLDGEINLPGSKSITNRALILAALSSSSVTIHNALMSEDTLTMVDALQKLGFYIEVDPVLYTIKVKGTSGIIPNSTAVINIGNAGTVARFITAILCLHPNGRYHLDGTPAMRKRPIQDLLEPLQNLGAVNIIYHQEFGHFPFTITTHGLSGGEIFVDASKSSQILSALFLISPLSSGLLTIKLKKSLVSQPFINMTLHMMREFGQKDLPSLGSVFSFPSLSFYTSISGTYIVEPDITAASYFFALALIQGGRLNFPGLTSSFLQGDIAFLEVLKTLGLKVEITSNSWIVHSPGLSFLSFNPIEIDFNDFSDTFPSLAAIAPLLKTTTQINRIEHTRFQESDRIAAVTKELRKLNQIVIETRDSITINSKPLIPAEIETYEDHRIAMGFAILGSYDFFENGNPWISIHNPNCCAKTFPNFFNVLENLRNPYKNNKWS